MNLEIKEHGREAIDEVPFSVRARVAMQLGRESISDSIVAILELVKNAYDADAENVHIYFVALETKKPFLVIEDDGTGMTSTQLKESWMVIGIDNKALNRRSRKQRALIGEKGLGRLGLDRLCKITSIQTFTADSSEGVEVIVHWDKYESNKVRLEQVKHSLYRLPNKEVVHPISADVYEKAHGTRLLLAELRDAWDEESIKNLRKQLSLLVSPFSGINDFRIFIHFESSIEEIYSDDMKEVAEWILHSELYVYPKLTGEPEWFIHHVMTNHDKIEYEYKAPWDKSLPKHKRKTPICGPLRFEMYFLPRMESEAAGVTRSQIRTFMDANQGIRIYRDNFRVKPYGEPTGEGDWLNLSYYRVQHPGPRGKRGWRVAYNQVFGAVFITRDENYDLLDQTNREGLVVGPAYEDLMQFARHAIEWFEKKDIEYVKAIDKPQKVEKIKQQAISTSIEAKQAVDEFKNTIDDVINQIATVTVGEKTDTAQIREQLEMAYSRVKETAEEARTRSEEMGRLYEEKVQELEEEKDTLANLASLGIMSVTFGHETLHYSNLVTTNTRILRKKLQTILPLQMQNPDDIVKTCIDDIEFGGGRIQTFADFTLKSVRRDKRKEVKVYLSKLIEEILNTFAPSLEEKRNIKVIRELDELGPIRAFIIDWESVVVNFITNAIWALEDTPADDRVIRVKLFLKDNLVHLLFADSGCGIAKDTIDRIFEPTFSTKRDKQGRPAGTGMGLYIVDTLVKSYGGNIKAESPSELGGAQFHIQIPHKVDLRGT